MDSHAPSGAPRQPSASAFVGRRLVAALPVAGLLLLAWLIPLPPEAGADARLGALLFALAAGLWVTELIPPFATAILVIVLSVHLLGRPAEPDADTWKLYLRPISDPTLALFFGGLVLARAATKYGFDLTMARLLLKPFGTHPALLLLGVILITAAFSMFMSNTSATAMMLAMITPLLASSSDDGLRRQFLLAVPFAANIGGVGTIIGTPPNAVAASLLRESLSAPISFAGWMLFGVPLALLMCGGLWLLLRLLFRSSARELQLTLEPPDVSHVGLVIVMTTFACTVLLWLSEGLHGLPAAVVALLPIAVLCVSGIIDRDDLHQLDWDVLILIAGGLTLGIVITRTGISDLLVSAVPLQGLPPWLILTGLGLIAVLLSNFMSNTAAANILAPIAAALPGVAPAPAVIMVAIAASLAMSLPVSTPPNALAYAKGGLSTGDLLRCGTLVTLLGLALALVAVLWVVQPMMG